MAEKLRVSLNSPLSTSPLSVKLNSTVSGGKVTMPLPTIVQSHKVEISDTPTEGGTSAFSTGGAFNLQEQINKKANIEDIPAIPDVPTKLSELENDKGFATKTEVDEAIRDNTPDLTPYVTDETLNATLEDYAKSTDIPSVEGLVTEDYVNGIIGDINSILDEINGEVI